MPIRFTAPVITGSGRGKSLGFPTINVDPNAVPESMKPGMFACRAAFDGETYDAVLHYGVRPTFNDSLSCEVHIFDQDIAVAPKKMTIEVVEKLRDIQAFASAQELQKQIQRDIERSRGILATHAE